MSMCFSGTKEFFIEMGHTANGPWTGLAEGLSSDPNVPMSSGVLEIIPMHELHKTRYLQYRCKGTTIYPYCGLQYIKAIGKYRKHIIFDCGGSH